MSSDGTGIGGRGLSGATLHWQTGLLRPSTPSASVMLTDHSR